MNNITFGYNEEGEPVFPEVIKKKYKLFRKLPLWDTFYCINIKDPEDYPIYEFTIIYHTEDIDFDIKTYKIDKERNPDSNQLLIKTFNSKTKQFEEISLEDISEPYRSRLFKHILSLKQEEYDEKI